MKYGAKFFAGFAGNQILMYEAMAVSDTWFSVFGIDYTAELSTVVAVVWE
ncbi:hypothetical protein [Sphingobium fuliginis]|nr:hypothetical protein [Sphingobium fuliginis]